MECPNHDVVAAKELFDLCENLDDELLARAVNDIGGKGLDVHLRVGGGPRDDALDDFAKDGLGDGDAIAVTHLVVDDRPELALVPVRMCG